MDPGDFWFRVALITILALAGLWFAHRSFKLSRLIEDMPTSRVRSASQGFVELVGVAQQLDAPRIAPLSSTLCLWWSYRIERYQKTGKSRHWTTVDKKSSSAPFAMRDETGSCEIVPEGADVHSRHRRRWYGSTPRPISAPPRAESGVSLSMQLGSIGRRYRYTEYVLLEGDPLYCLGRFVSDEEGRRTMSLDSMTGDILRHWKTDFEKLLDTYDSNQDGELDSKEWEKVRRVARAEAVKQQKQQAGEELAHQMVQPQASGLPFIIANEMQESLSTRFRWKAVGSALLFLGAGAMTTWLISVRSFT